MFESSYPPRKDHFVTAKMLDIYQASAETQLQTFIALGNAKPSSDDINASLELKIKINMQTAFLKQIKRIRKNYFDKLYAIAMMYTDVELKIFSLSLLKGATDRFISEELGMSINFVKEVKEKLKKEIDSIVLTNDINGV
jgi:hypothetical protein